jgi:uncharacterized membrane protein
MRLKINNSCKSIKIFKYKIVKKFILVVVGFEVWAVYLLGRCYNHPSHTPQPFGLVIMEKRSHFLPRAAWSSSFLFILPAIARMTGTCHHSRFFPLKLGLKNFP